ncbi:hypothetical protein ACFXKY_07725 [Streptomyces canus]|uniref:hypothetical protein n=1 Tax=Streptomyces canus TaxID=58343 RepID=UPI00367671B7
MRLVSAAKYAALQLRLQRVEQAREKAEKTAAERQATITRQAEEIRRLRDERPDSPVETPAPVRGDAELRRQLDLARRQLRELGARVDDLQASHVADTRELHDLRQGVTS